MSHNESIHSIVFSSSCPDIVKRTSISSVFTSLGMLFTGVLAIAATFSFEDKSSTTSMALMVLGTALLLVSIFRLFWKSKQVVYLPTGSSTREFSAYFDLTYLNSLQELLTSGSVPSSSHFQMVESGNIRMDVLYSSDEKFFSSFHINMSQSLGSIILKMQMLRHSFPSLRVKMYSYIFLPFIH